MHQIRLVRNVRLGIKTLLLHKLRSMLTVLGMVCGVGSVIAMLSVGEGASAQALEDIRKLGSNNIIIRSIKPTDEQTTMERSFVSVYGLLRADQERLETSMPYVNRVVPVKEIMRESRVGERTLDLRLVGTTPEWFQLVEREIIAGRTISWHDMASFNPVCVLTEHGAHRLLVTRHVIGEHVRIGAQYYQVIGIVRSEAAGGSLQVPDSAVDAYVPINVARERYGDINIQRSTGSFQAEQVELHSILVQIDDRDNVERAARAITAMLGRFHSRNDFRIEVPLALLRQAERTKRQMNLVLGAIAGISLLVGGIGIMNIMLASVTERTREIGIRRAIGARQRQIVSQFLVETVVLSTVGGLVGILVGLSLPWVITYFSDMPTVTPLYSVVLSLGISIGVGIIFGLYPAFRAAKLDPIVALRHE